MNQIRLISFLRNQTLRNFTKLISAFLRPFKIIFKTNNDELTIANIGANNNEESLFPGGIIGFQLSYAQINC
jgi:hypothetical protein